MTPESHCAVPAPEDLAARARAALERVCSGAGLDPASRYYAPSFADHVNDMEFGGLDGVRRSVGLYRSVFSEMAISVEGQVVQGDQVASRFVVTGTSLGRAVRFTGVAISRFEDGMIVEDWTVTDTLGMLRQLGLWRSLLAAVRQWRMLRSAAVRGATPPVRMGPSAEAPARGG